MTEFKQLKGVRALIFNRDSFKRKITSAIRLMSAETTLNGTCFKKQETLINKWLIEVDTINTKISEACEKADIHLENSGLLEDEHAEAQFAYNINKELTELEEKISSSSTNSAITVQNTQVQAATTCVPAPRLQCVKFSGIRAGKFEFKNFLVQFENCVDAVHSKKAKLSLLKSFLTGYASQLVAHLSLEDENFEVAVNLLRKEFLDIPLIIDEIFKQLLSSSPKYDPEFVSVKSFLSEIKADLSELKTSYGFVVFLLVCINRRQHKLEAKLFIPFFYLLLVEITGAGSRGYIFAWLTVIVVVPLVQGLCINSFSPPVSHLPSPILTILSLLPLFHFLYFPNSSSYYLVSDSLFPIF